ncbi:MAG: (2Fe-2S)-binding protein [Acidobacteriota bacterium]|nr:(2Fe-2S)-binding protein [Blastocatellia bacterium]MDW8239774.1 (2Fe-2S)-binding protein [Acidobacteriota bacterium]
MRIELTINHQTKSFEIRPNLLLMELLRQQRCYSVKHGCETGDCGACAALVNGKLVNTCIMLAAQADGADIITLEAIGAPERLDPLQAAFVDTGAIQCGYCTPAMILAAKELLDRNSHPTEADVRDALAGVLCRCTGYVKPVEAVLRAAQQR